MNDDFSVSDELFAEMHELVTAILGGSATIEQKDRLEELIRQDIGACDLYLKLVFESSALLDWARCEEPSDRTAMDHATPGLPLIAISPPFQEAPGFFSSSWLAAYLVAFVIIAVGLLSSAFVYISQPVPMARQSAPAVVPHRPETIFVGHITQMVNCEWADDKTAAFNGASVPLHRKYALASGLMEITYDTGDKVILEGPCTYEAATESSGYLSLGKLTARVDKQGEKGTKPDPTNGPTMTPSSSPFPLPLSPLFSVRTPTAIVTDLGTEFGVEYDKSGVTRSLVFRGSVTLQAISADGETQGSAQVLRENQFARVEKNGANPIVLEASAKPPAFVRKMPKQTLRVFDLVDVVAGGDGFSGRRDGGINPSDGSMLHGPAMIEYYTKHPNKDQFRGDGRYHRVEGQTFIDGVFIPNGKQGPVQVDSAGHRFDGFPPTTNIASGWIQSGGAIPWLMEGRVIGVLSCVLGGIDYSSPGHGVLFIHANKGITFDLDAIRAANRNCRIVAFRAVAGVAPEGRIADLWVLVDGKSQFVRRQVNSFSGPMPVAIPIRSGNRFLTLAATDGDGNVSADLTMFGDPRLEIISDDSGERRTTNADKDR